MRWVMCKCGVKMLQNELNDKVTVYKCPVCRESKIVLNGREIRY
jgi:Zn finger protein HypA/HybF involved in hydrogenase expression